VDRLLLLGWGPFLDLSALSMLQPTISLLVAWSPSRMRPRLWAGPAAGWGRCDAHRATVDGIGSGVKLGVRSEEGVAEAIFNHMRRGYGEPVTSGQRRLAEGRWVRIGDAGDGTCGAQRWGCTLHTRATYHVVGPSFNQGSTYCWSQRHGRSCPSMENW
jgi:hypothetical protein